MGVLNDFGERGWDVEKSYLRPPVTCLVRQVVGCYFLLMRNTSPPAEDKRKRQAIATLSTLHGDKQRDPWTCLEGKDNKVWDPLISRGKLSRT